MDRIRIAFQVGVEWSVLILILMEYGQNNIMVFTKKVLFVLILILMEYGQNEQAPDGSCIYAVLILILMEYGQNNPIYQ